jgi:MFS family permease
LIYFIFMMAGALGYRVPPLGWKPAGWTPSVKASNNTMITHRHVHLNTVRKTPQFWLIWLVLMLNVSAGIGVLAMASPLLQEVFGGRLLGITSAFNDLNTEQKKAIASIAAGFLGLISLFNIGGRIVWASLSDYIGRKGTYCVFFILGLILYASIPTLAQAGNLPLFAISFCIILSMYGGGFATVPAYLADMFGTQMVGAIHGRLLTAWSTAGIFGPVLITYLRESKIAQGVPKAEAYNEIMYILAGMLVLGLICNLLIRPVADKYFMSEQELAKERQLAHEREMAGASGAAASTQAGESSMVIVVLAWAAVVIPIIWGVMVTLEKAAILFK